MFQTIVKANARYFVRRGWEQPEIMSRLDRWFNGNEDKELGGKVVSWCHSDARWIRETLPSIARHFWYVAPVAYFVAWYMRRMLLGEAGRIHSHGYSYKED